MVEKFDFGDVPVIGTLRLDGLVFIPKVEVSGHRCVNWVWQLLFYHLWLERNSRILTQKYCSAADINSAIVAN